MATQVAVSKAIRATGATKVITFHSRVNQAAVFASATPRGIGQYLDGFIVDHVNGTQRVADRKDILSGFRDARRRLVTNARCLTEGVDLPAVDMVVFSNPRRSRVDIVQAVGRAMRKPREGTKTPGYVVVAVLLAPHQTSDLTEACANTDWEDVVDVLTALGEQDARLEEIIRDQQIAKGRGEVFDPRAFTERVQVLGPLVELDTLERHIGAVVLDRLGVPWDKHYGELVAFKAKHGHCWVPQNYPESPRLSTWMNSQRARKREGDLSQERINRLAYRAVHRDCNVPQTSPSDPELGHWCTRQRMLRTRGRLSSRRIARLDALGFVWEPRDAAWEEMFSRLAAYKVAHGNGDMAESHPAGAELLRWCRKQRGRRRKGTLSSVRASPQVFHRQSIAGNAILRMIFGAGDRT